MSPSNTSWLLCSASRGLLRDYEPSDETFSSTTQQTGGVAWRHNPRRSEMDTATRRSWRQVCTRAPGRRSVVGSVPTSSSQQAAHDTSSAAPDFMQHTHRLWCEPAPQLSAVSIVLISPDISSALTLCPAVFAVPALQQLQYLQCRAGQVEGSRRDGGTSTL